MKYIVFLSFIACAIIATLPSEAYSQYKVSGVVEFTYESFSVKTGDVKTSDSRFTQNYQAGIITPFLDPRFLIISAGVNYSISSSSKSPDQTLLGYNIRADFFPGRMISWDIYGKRAVSSIDSKALISGYDVTTTEYGGTLNLNLSRMSGPNGNNTANSNNNNNNSNQGRRIILPDFTLSRFHTEMDSTSSVNPLDETRDTTRATATYKIPNGNLTVQADGGIEDYENRQTGSSYESKSVNVFSNARITGSADLRLTGAVRDLSTNGISGFANSTSTQQYSATVDVHEHNRLSQMYRYDYFTMEQANQDFVKHNAETRLTYRLTTEVSLLGGASLGETTNTQNDPSTGIYQKTEIVSESLLAGASYKKTFQPAFIEPFVLDTSYTLGMGMQDVSNTTNAATTDISGGGWYYTNDAMIGLNSSGWKQERLGMSYNYFNRRDNSPQHYNTERNSYTFQASTQRVPRTNINATGNYSSEHNTSEGADSSIFIVTGAGVVTVPNDRHTRSFNYSLTADHFLNEYLAFSAGATRGVTTINNVTLSTLGPAPGVATSSGQAIENSYFGQATARYNFTRNLSGSLISRAERRTSRSNPDVTEYTGTASMLYRIRMINLSGEYRIREQHTDGSPNSLQQYYFIKLSRPF